MQCLHRVIASLLVRTPDSVVQSRLQVKWVLRSKWYPTLQREMMYDKIASMTPLKKGAHIFNLMRVW